MLTNLWNRWNELNERFSLNFGLMGALVGYFVAASLYSLTPSDGNIVPFAASSLLVQLLSAITFAHQAIAARDSSMTARTTVWVCVAASLVGAVAAFGLLLEKNKIELHVNRGSGHTFPYLYIMYGAACASSATLLWALSKEWFFGAGAVDTSALMALDQGRRAANVGGATINGGKPLGTRFVLPMLNRQYLAALTVIPLLFGGVLGFFLRASAKRGGSVWWVLGAVGVGSVAGLIIGRFHAASNDTAEIGEVIAGINDAGIELEGNENLTDA